MFLSWWASRPQVYHFLSPPFLLPSWHKPLFHGCAQAVAWGSLPLESWHLCEKDCAHTSPLAASLSPPVAGAGADNSGNGVLQKRLRRGSCVLGPLWVTDMLKMERTYMTTVFWQPYQNDLTTGCCLFGKMHSRPVCVSRELSAIMILAELKS